MAEINVIDELEKAERAEGTERHPPVGARTPKGPSHWIQLCRLRLSSQI